MTALDREEFVELGLSVPTDFLTQWASNQLAAAKGREPRLELRGLSPSYLSELQHLIEQVGRAHLELGDRQALPPPEGALAERLRAEAFAYWREAKQIARVAFAGDPDNLAKFRTGVETGLLIMNLVRELESMLVLLREHAGALARFGVSEAFLGRGASVVARLRAAKMEMDAACRDLPPTALQQFHDKGVLYDRTRMLVRVGRLEFHLDPEQASQFNFKLVRRDRGVSTRPRLKKARP